MVGDLRRARLVVGNAVSELLILLGIILAGVSGVPGLLLAVRSGGVVLANAHGAGVIEEPALAPLWPEAVRHLTGTELLLTQLDGRSVELATTPVYDGTSLRDGSAVVRLFACHDGRTVAVMPGGTGRVLAPGDHPALPTAAAAKDVWVVGRTLTPLVAPPLPQVDLARSVPTRAADAASRPWRDGPQHCPSTRTCANN